MITIRIERPDDFPHVRMIHEQAFKQPAEANVIDQLRQTCFSLLSLVAEDDHRRVGHILFSPAVIDHSGRPIEGI